MSSSPQRPALHRSIFVRLVTIMVVMVASLLLMVTGFYFGIVIPDMHELLSELGSEHARAIAAQKPDLAAAREYTSHLNLEIRFEGQDEGWTTDETLLTSAELRHLAGQNIWAHYMQMLRAPRTYIMVVRDDGNYIFAHGYGGDFSRMHRQLLWGLLIIMIGVVLTAYLVMKRALIPLRLLNIGVAQLSEGQLDVVVPKKSDDEFGVLTEAFNRMALRVGNMIQARDQLLLDVSHELRSPLTRLRVALELMPDSARRQTMVTDLNEMETMVTELLELHRLKSGVSRPSTQVNLVAIVSEVVERYEGQPPGVSIKAQQPELMVAAEAARVRTIVRNLLENALKFSLPDSGPIEINLTRSESSVVLRLTDDGVGVPDGDLERLFEPFYRLDKSRSRRTGGYGLGLSMCKRLMEAHGGKIALTRNETRGLTVVLEFSTSQV